MAEAKKLAISEGWSDSCKLVENKVNQDIVTEEPKVELEEVKKLTEEFKRMKELIDFRSPLLKKDE